MVYSKRPFAGPQQVLAYLSRYTHRVGLSNRRLLQLDRGAGTVTFDYKDYADGARHKSMQLGLDEFVRRLRLHFLPPRFVKIRHYGLLANRGRAAAAGAGAGVAGAPRRATRTGSGAGAHAARPCRFVRTAAGRRLSWSAWCRRSASSPRRP